MTELPVIMDSLEIDDNPAQTVETEKKKRSEALCEVLRQMMRERAQGTDQPHEFLKITDQPREFSKRRACLPPMKLNRSKKTDDAGSYFTSKKFRPFKVKSLATIYEEPIVKEDGTVVHTGQTKIRKINFNVIRKDKIRKAKMKKVISSTNLKNRKLSMDEFLPRLEGLLGSSSTGNSDINVITSLENCEVE